MSKASGASVPDRAGGPADPSPAVSAKGAHPSRDFIVKRWRVSVVGYGECCYEAASRGQAMAHAWRCDAFGHLKFGDFLKIARCFRDRDLPPRWGDPITVGGRPAFFLENNRQYVRFAYPGWAAPSNAHPYDVLPVEYRPDTYRDRDSDEHRDGEDPKGLSGEAMPARAEGIAQPPAKDHP